MKLRPKLTITVTYDEAGNIELIDMPKPSNFHAHLRTGALMRTVAREIMRWVKHLLIMPNTGPIDTVAKVRALYDELRTLAEELGIEVNLIMTIYFTDKLTPHMIDELMRLPFRVAVKYYPYHRPNQEGTTGSGLGVPLRQMPETLRHMANVRMRLLGHFESIEYRNGRTIPMEHRESYFMKQEFPWLRDTFPELDINIEHGSTIAAVRRVKEDTSGKTTIGFTPHHLLMPLDKLMQLSWRNLGRCMPYPKTEDDVWECREFATSGDSRAHAGDDTAPHPLRSKTGPFEKAACGCWLPHSLAMYARVFHLKRALDERFVRFMCTNGPDTWGLPWPEEHERVRLIRETVHDIPDPLQIVDGSDIVVPYGWTEANDRLKVGTMLVQ